MSSIIGTAWSQTTGTYTDTNGGNWSDTASWSGGIVPNGIDHIANLLNVLAANSTVTLDVPVTLGVLNFGDTSQSYTIAGSGANVLTFDVATGAAQLNFGSGGNSTANNTISAGIVLNDQLDIVLNDTGHRQLLTLSGIISTGVGGPAAGAVALNISNPTAVPTGSSLLWNEIIISGSNTFTGQVVVNSGALRYESTNLSAGASGVGNETIVTGTGRVDLRGLNFKQNATVAEIFRINGHGLYNSGALVNSTGTAAINQLILDGNSTVNSESRIDLRQVEGGGAFATLDMGGFALNKFGEGDFALIDTTILNPGVINVHEGELRIESSSASSSNPTLASGLTINVAYNPNPYDGLDPANGTRTSGDLYNLTNIGDTAGNALSEARVEFYNSNATHTGVQINLNRGSIDRNGVTSTGASFNTILDVTSTITLVGGTVRDNFFNIAGGSANYNSGLGAYDDPGAMIIEGEIVGGPDTGITKRGNRELRLTNANANFTGTFLIKQNPGRYLPAGFQTSGGQIEKQWASVALSGASGGLTGASRVEITRSATLWLDNTAANNNDRLNDLGVMDLKNGFLLLTTNAGATNTENFGTVNSSVGTNKLFIDTRAGGLADISMESLNIAEGSVMKIAYVDSTATWGTTAADNRIALNDSSSVTLIGNATGGADRAVVLGAFGSVSPGAGGATVTRPLSALENGQARSNAMARLLTVENVGGVDYLRPLLNSEYDTSAADPSANANWMITSPLGTMGNKNNAINISSSRTINSLTIGDLSNDNNNGEYVRIANGETLTINSGIINFASYGFGNSVNTEASVRGGMISMNGRMAIINSGSFWEDLDRNDANYYAYLSGNSAYIRSNIVNADGLLKTGRNNLYLDTWNQFIAGSKAYVTDEASLVARHSGALSGISEVVITGQGNFLLQGGVNITGTDIRVTPLDSDRVILRSESHHNTWGGNIILDTVDASGSKEYQRNRITALGNATLTLYGDIYVDPAASANATASDLWDDPFVLAHDSGANGIVNLRGRVMDLPTGPLGMPVRGHGDTTTTIDRNHSLRFQITGADDANLNVFQQWNATGRIDIRQGYFRVMYDPTTSPDGTGFLSDTARSRILANDYWTRLVLGADGTGTNTYHSHLMLTRAGQVINHPYIYSYNDNRNGTQTIGGENRSGTVYLGSSDNSVNFSLQFANQTGDRDIRFWQMRGGTMVFNGRMDDEGTSVNSSISVLGPGTVRFNGNAIGSSDVERWNFMGGSTIWGNHLSSNRFAASTARTTFGGGTLTLEAQGSAFSHTLSGNIYLLAGSGGIEAQNNTTLTLGSGTAVLTRRTGSTLAFTESGNGAINFTSTAGTPTVDGDRFDSWAVYGSSLNNITDWAARSGTTGVQAFTGYTDDTFTTGTHTNVTNNAVLGGSASTGSIRFAASASIDIGGAGNTLTVENGGILIPTSVAGPVSIGNGNLTSAWASGSRDLVLHNYGTGTTTISAAIVDNGTDKVNFVHSGTGTTVLEADNTFTGDMHINGGVVSISSDGQLGDVNGTITRLVFMNGGTGHTNNVAGGALIFNSASAPGTAATGTFNTNGTGNVSSITLTGGGSGYTNGVWVQSETTAGSELFAGIWAIMDSGNLHLNGGALQVTDDISLNGARTIYLGANGGTLDVLAGKTLTINGLITSEASHVNSANGFANADHVGGATQRYTDRNPDMGDLIIEGGGRVVISADPDGGGAIRSYLAPVIGGITWINTGTLRLNMAGSASGEWLGSNRSFADSTVIGQNGTLELAATSDGDVYEWFTFEGKGYLGGGTIRTVSTARTYDFTGQLFIDSDIYINNKNSSNVYFGESTGAFYGQGNIIRGGGGGEFRIYTNAPEWTGKLILGGGLNRIYGSGKIGGSTGLTLTRNSYLGLGNGSTSENQFDNRLPDNLAIDSNGWTRLRMEASGGVYSGVERAGTYTARWGTAGIEVDLGADIVAGAARLTGDYAGFRFTELVRENGAVFQFRSLDGGTTIAGGDFTTQSEGNQALFMVDTLPEMFGTGDGTNGDTKIIAGFFGGSRPEWFSDTTDQRMSESFSARHMMTAEQGIDPTTGQAVYFLRPLSDAPGSTDYHKVGSAADVVNAGSLSVLHSCDINAAQNLRLTGIQTDAIGVNQLTGRRDQIVTLGENITINSFSIGLDVYGNGANGNGETMSFMLRRDTTVTVNSGVLAFNGLGVQNRNGSGLDTNANLDMRGYVQGGTFDFNGQQAILFNMNRWVHYNTSDDLNAYRAEDGDNTHVRINTSITNTGGNGLIKAGGASIFLEGANFYTGDTTIVEGTLYLRNNRALGLSERVNVVADGQLVIGQGTYIDGVDLYVGPLNGNKLVLWGEQDGGYWGGDIILDNIDASGNAGGFQRNFTARIGNASTAIFTLGGDIYGGGLDANAYAVAGAEGGVARIFSTLTSAAGMLDIRGRVRDTAAGAVGAPVTTANQNDVLRMEVVASNNENTVQLWQSYDAAGRISLLRGSLRYAGGGNFYTAGAAAALNPDNFMSGFHMGGRSVIDNNGGLGTGDSTSNGNLGFFLANGGTTFNLSSWTVGGDPYDRENLNGNDNWGRGNNIGNSTLGGENRSGEVIFGTGTGTVTFTPYRTAGSNRDLRLYAAKGGEVTMRVNFVDGGNSVNPVNTSLTKVGSGQVNLQGSSAGGSTVEGLNVLGGVLVMEGYGSNLNRRVGNGASLLMGGGILFMDGSEASFTENFSALTVNQGGNGLAAAGNGLGAFGTISIGGAGITRNAAGTLHFQSVAGGVIQFSNAAMASVARLGSYATFGSNLSPSAFATDWAATDASGNVIAYSGYSTNSFGAGQHTDVTGAGLAAATTDSVRFNTATGTIGSGSLVLNDGGILITSNHTGGIPIAAGVGITTSGVGVDLLVHNYASSAVTIEGDISGGQNVVFTGTGETVLSGTNTYTGATHLGGAAVVSVDGLDRFGATSGFFINGGTLRYTGSVPSTVLTTGVTLGGGDGNIDIADAGGVLISKAVFSSVTTNVIASYGSNNPNSGGLFVTGLGTFQMGDRTAASDTQDLGGLMNTYTGVTVIGDGIQTTRVDVQGMVNDNGNITPFGSTDGWADGTIVRNNSILEFSPKRGDGSRDNQVRVREWIQFGESSTDNVTLKLTTQRELVLDGIINVVGNLRIEANTGGYADAGGTGSGSVNFGINEGGFYGDGNITINGDGTVSFRSSMPNFTGDIDLQDGNLNIYGNGLPMGSGTSPLMMGLNGETGQVRLLHIAENGNNSPTAAFDSGATDYIIARDIIVRNTSQDVRIGGGYYALNGTIRFTGHIQLGDGGPGATPTVRLYYEDSEGLDQSIYGVQQQTIFEFSGGFSGAGNLLIDVNETGSGINDTANDIYGIFHFTADNSAWTGMLDIGPDAGTTLDTDDTSVVRLGHINALNDNQVRFRNSGILQMAGLSKTFTQDFKFIGGVGLHTSARIENAGPVDSWITFNSVKIGVQFQDVGVGLSDGSYWTDLGNVSGKLGVIKTGSGNTVLGAATGGDGTPGSFSNYTGETRVQEGILYAGSNNAFSPNSRVVVSDNAELSLYWDQAGSGFDNTIGSLVGAILAQVDIHNSILRVGGDGTHDADFGGLISGDGAFYKVGSGTQRLSGNNTFKGNIGVAQGTLVGGNNNAFGDSSNIIYLGGVPLDGNTPLDARAELLLDGTANAVNQPIVMNVSDGNDEGITVIGTRATSGTYGLTSTGTVDMAQNLFAESAGNSTFRFGGAIRDFGSEKSIIKVGTGVVELAAANTYGPAGVAGSAINGGTVIRHGTITIADELALGSTVVEMGDTHRALSQNAYLATTKSLISPGAGSFDGASDGAGGAGNGAFLNVKAEVDGIAITSTDIGKWILVKNEGADPERNGVYQIVSVDPTCGQMNLVRVDEFDDSSEMLYGTSVGVTSGTYAGTRHFMASQDVTSVNADNTDPVHWMAETQNPDIALLATQSGMLVANAMDINDTNGSGTTTIGGTFASGTTTFQGDITLQHQTLPGVDNVREIILTSASDTDDGSGARGTIFSGVISEADAGDTLSVQVVGPGTVTMSNSNTYKGKTTVTSGTLALEGSGDISQTSWLEIAQAAKFDTAAVAGGDYTLDTVVSGSGNIVTGAGRFTVGADGGAGVLRPGMSSNPSDAGTAGNLIGTLTVTGNLGLAGDATGTNRLVLQLGATNGADHNDAANFGAQLAAGTFSTYLQSQADTYDTFTGGNHDRLVITGSLELDAGGYIVLDNNNGASYSPVFGDIFNLMDWAEGMLIQNDFDFGPTHQAGGQQGDLNLPTLGGGLVFDTSIFSSHGILVVVPEPSRALLLVLGLMCLTARRRRKANAGVLS